MAKTAASILSSSITVSHQRGTVYEKSVSARVGRSPRWHSKAPASVMLDNSLSDAARVVYCAMGLKTRGNTCSIGVRYLGRILGRGRSTASRLVNELVRAGHLELTGGGKGNRAVYRLTSPAYLKTCRGCKRITEDIRISGLCWICDERQSKIA